MWVKFYKINHIHLLVCLLIPLLLGHHPPILSHLAVLLCARSFAPCLGKQFKLPLVLFGMKLKPSHQSSSVEQYSAHIAKESTSL